MVGMSLVFLRWHDVEAAASQVRGKHCGILKRLIGKERLRLALIEVGCCVGPSGRAQEARGCYEVVKHKLRGRDGGQWMNAERQRAIRTVPYLQTGKQRL